MQNWTETLQNINKEFTYRIPPTTEIIEGRECERIHFLDAIKKYPDKHIVWVNNEIVNDTEEISDNFIVTIIGVFTDDENYEEVWLEYWNKGYEVFERRTTEGALVLCLD